MVLVQEGEGEGEEEEQQMREVREQCGFGGCVERTPMVVDGKDGGVGGVGVGLAAGGYLPAYRGGLPEGGDTPPYISLYKHCQVSVAKCGGLW